MEFGVSEESNEIEVVDLCENVSKIKQIQMIDFNCVFVNRFVVRLDVNAWLIRIPMNQFVNASKNVAIKTNHEEW